VRVTQDSLQVGAKIGGPGRWMAKSACLSTAPIGPGVGGNGTCFARNMAPGTDPALIAALEQHACVWGDKPGSDKWDECYLYEPLHRIIGNPADYVVLKGGMLGHPNFFADGRDGEMLRKAGAVDFYGRRAKTTDGGRSWYLVAHTGPNGELLSDPAHSWTYHTLVPPAVFSACPEPTPEPPPVIPPTVEGMSITIVVTCGGKSPNCSPKEVQGYLPNDRHWDGKIQGDIGKSDFVLDASYYLNTQANKIHSYDPRFPGPLGEWEQLAGPDHVDCTDLFAIDSNGMVIRCMDVAVPGTYVWKACNPARICGQVAINVR